MFSVVYFIKGRQFTCSFRGTYAHALILKKALGPTCTVTQR